MGAWRAQRREGKDGSERSGDSSKGGSEEPSVPGTETSWSLPAKVPAGSAEVLHPGCGSLAAGRTDARLLPGMSLLHSLFNDLCFKNL